MVNDIDGALNELGYEEKDEINDLKEQILTLLVSRKRNQATELIVEAIKNNHYIYTTRDDIKSEMWIYKEGIYVPQGKSFVKEYCRELLGEAYTTQIANEIVNKIETDTPIDQKEFFQEKYYDKIPVKNGILNILTKELEPFSHDKIFFNKLPIKYDKSKDCPTIKKFFKEVLKYEEDANVILELIGFCLYKKYCFEKAFMFVGSGRNGKGKTLSLIKRFLGVENCSAIPLSQLKPDSSSVCELHGRLVNVAGDLSNTDLKDTGMFKQVTGRDLINAKRKFLKDLIFENYAKLVFACNELPKVYDMSIGFWSRWILLEFPYKFIKKEEYDKLSVEEKKFCKIEDPEIIEKISTDNELSGLLNVSLDALQLLIENKGFNYTKGTNEVKDLWIRQSDSFTAFCIDHLQENHQVRISKKQLRRFFHKYCKKHKLKGTSDNSIKITLENMFGVIESRGTDLERVWEGIEFKNIRNIHTNSKSHRNLISYTIEKPMDSMDVLENSRKKSSFNRLNEQLDQISPETINEVGLMIHELQEKYGKLIPIDLLIANFQDKFSKEEILRSIEKLKSNGIIFEPREKFVQLMD